MSKRSLALMAAMVTFAAGCVSNDPDTSAPDTNANTAPVVSVTIPPTRLTPFCETMIDLSDRLRAGEVDDGEALIIETYRSIEAEVPPEISSDFAAVLVALETGAPAPTDPPLPTTPTDTEGAGEAGAGSVSTGAPGVDVGYAAGNSPSERINNYVSFACRDTQNNPGPPATEPLEEPPPTTP